MYNSLCFQVGRSDGLASQLRSAERRVCETAFAVVFKHVQLPVACL